MGKVTRGTLLATLKELKKHNRPKPATTAVAVQAICPKQSKAVDRNAEIRASIERRRTLFNGPIDTASTREELVKFNSEFEEFMLEYNKLNS